MPLFSLLHRRVKDEVQENQVKETEVQENDAEGNHKKELDPPAEEGEEEHETESEEHPVPAIGTKRKASTTLSDNPPSSPKALKLIDSAEE